jgi:hypothetical protein
LEYIAFGIMAVTDLDAFEFPLTLHSIHSATELGGAVSRRCNISDTEHGLDWSILTRFRGRSDVDRVCDVLWDTHDDESGRFAPEHGESRFNLLQFEAYDRRIELHEVIEVLRVEDGADQSAMRHALTRMFEERCETISLHLKVHPDCHLEAASVESPAPAAT